MTASPAKFSCSGSVRGPFNDAVARMAADIMRTAKTSGNPPAHISAVLDVVRDVYADDPEFVTAVCKAVWYFGEERGLLEPISSLAN